MNGWTWDFMWDFLEKNLKEKSAFVFGTELILRHASTWSFSYSLIQREVRVSNVYMEGLCWNQDVTLMSSTDTNILENSVII